MVADPAAYPWSGYAAKVLGGRDPVVLLGNVFRALKKGGVLPFERLHKNSTYNSFNPDGATVRNKRHELFAGWEYFLPMRSSIRFSRSERLTNFKPYRFGAPLGSFSC